MIKSLSLAAIAVLAIAGCKSGSNDVNNGRTGASNIKTVQDVSTLSSAEKLAYALAHQDSVLESVAGEKKPGNQSRRTRDLFPCENRNGTMEVFFDVPVSELTGDEEPSKVVFNNCQMAGETINGDMEYQRGDDGTETISTVNGFSVTGGDVPGSVLPGGTISIKPEGDWSVMTINLEMEINGIKHGGENLIYRAKELADGGTIEYPVSGKEKIGESDYFTVDPAYDASATPFYTDANDNLLNGKFKYLDKNDHAVELEVTAKNVVTVRVDEDGNGSFGDDEVSAIKLD